MSQARPLVRELTLMVQHRQNVATRGDRVRVPTHHANYWIGEPREPANPIAVRDSRHTNKVLGRFRIDNGARR